MRNLVLIIAVPLFACATSNSANAVPHFYEIDAFCSQCGQPAGANNSITGSLMMDASAGPASITKINIHATIPTIGGSLNFSFDQVAAPVDTWKAGYLLFTSQQFGSGEYFRMYVKNDTSTNDGSYLIGMGGNPFNPHHSEISSILYANNWQGIVGQMTIAVPGPNVGAGLPGLLMAIAGFIGWRRCRRASPLSLERSPAALSGRILR